MEAGCFKVLYQNILMESLVEGQSVAKIHNQPR